MTPRRPLWFLCPRCRWSISTRGPAVIFLFRRWAHQVRWGHPPALMVPPGFERVLGFGGAYVEFPDGSVLP
ncbi:MAG: hypothetical protein KGJ23_08450 [Euryarchaeota archaeon]|nr:hypothetical protein [Euryarchaeota archaeon]MDE1836632.1 hypothetical protein [Euryarchaeota archaeon]MDE1879173.1 hypothetical protein [Euryarchaeota archaeon]MDE2044602.1 hypothetical protein [Thermoplasmata archaeon]